MVVLSDRGSYSIDFNITINFNSAYKYCNDNRRPIIKRTLWGEAYMPEASSIIDDAFVVGVVANRNGNDKLCLQTVKPATPMNTYYSAVSFSTKKFKSTGE